VGVGAASANGSRHRAQRATAPPPADRSTSRRTRSPIVEAAGHRYRDASKASSTALSLRRGKTGDTQPKIDHRPVRSPGFHRMAKLHDRARGRINPPSQRRKVAPIGGHLSAVRPGDSCASHNTVNRHRDPLPIHNERGLLIHSRRSLFQGTGKISPLADERKPCNLCRRSKLSPMCSRSGPSATPT